MAKDAAKGHAGRELAQGQAKIAALRRKLDSILKAGWGMKIRRDLIAGMLDQARKRRASQAELLAIEGRGPRQADEIAALEKAIKEARANIPARHKPGCGLPPGMPTERELYDAARGDRERMEALDPPFANL